MPKKVVSTGLRMTNSTLATTGNKSMTTRLRRVATVDLKGVLEFVFPTFRVTPKEVALPNNYNVQVAIEPTFRALNTGLNLSTKIKSNIVSLNVSDVLGYVVATLDLGATVIPKGSVFGLWTTVDNVDLAEVSITNRGVINHPTINYNESRVYAVSASCGTSFVDNLASMSVINNSFTAGYSPLAILADVPSHVLTSVVCGDSICFGDYDGQGGAETFLNAYGDTWANIGLSKKLTEFGNASLNMSVGSDRVNYWVTGGGGTEYTRRKAIIDYCKPDVMLCAIGINDIAGGRTAPQIKADTKTHLDSFTGIKKIVSTILPSATSSDNFLTVANQTPATQNGGVGSTRGLINVDLRNNGAVGFGGEAIWDRCPPVEFDYLNCSGKWNTGPSSEPPKNYTSDGTHPTAVGVDRIRDFSGDIPFWYFTVGTGGQYATPNDAKTAITASNPTLPILIYQLDVSTDFSGFPSTINGQPVTISKQYLASNKLSYSYGYSYTYSY